MEDKKEKEIKLFEKAVEDMRKRGEGELVFCFNKNGYLYKIKDEDIFHEDERVVFEQAVEDMRKRGIGEITLCFKNSYVYRVKFTLDSFTLRENNHAKNS